MISIRPLRAAKVTAGLADPTGGDQDSLGRGPVVHDTGQGVDRFEADEVTVQYRAEPQRLVRARDGPDSRSKEGAPMFPFGRAPADRAVWGHRPSERDS